jgi:hypothetical protein
VLGHFDTLARSVNHIHSPMKMEQTRRSETSAIKHHTPGNNAQDYTRHLEHGERLKSSVTDVLSTELGIRLSFVKISEFRGGGGVNPTNTPLSTPLRVATHVFECYFIFLFNGQVVQREEPNKTGSVRIAQH